jgi:ABC-type transporter Mla subunit MlaD
MKRIAVIVSVLVVVAVLGTVATRPSRGDGGPYLVRAIFDDAAFAVPGEDVRIAGAPVGSIKSLDVTKAKRAAVTIEIDNAAFTPFYLNASCSIRPQSLIAERYVDCTPGSARGSRPLPRVNSGPGKGSYLLPVTRTHSPVDSDIVQDISTEPMRARLTIILSELGTGLAARGTDLNAVIHRANPALGYTDEVLKILARQNRILAQLATDGDAVLRPLARVRLSMKDFIVQANTTAVASASRARDIARSFQLLPGFLQQLRPLMVDLGQLADQGTPLMSSLGQSASALGRQFENLTPFAKAARPALIELGSALKTSQPLLLSSTPLANRLNRLGTQAEPAASLLNKLTASLNSTGAIEQLMAVLFYGTSAANTFDSIGHYVRAQGLVGDCTGFALVPVTGCSANFTSSAAADLGSGMTARQRANLARARQTKRAKQAKVGAGRTAATGGGNAAAGQQQAGERQAGQQQLTSLLRYLIGKGGR